MPWVARPTCRLFHDIETKNSKTGVVRKTATGARCAMMSSSLLQVIRMVDIVCLERQHLRVEDVSKALMSVSELVAGHQVIFDAAGGIDMRRAVHTESGTPTNHPVHTRPVTLQWRHGLPILLHASL